MSVLRKKYCIFALVIVALSDGRCELPDIAAVNKLFEKGRYAEALKGYASCERVQIGERGFVILREAICAEKTGDSVSRGFALKKRLSGNSAAGGMLQRLLELN